jgi:protein phosphatase
MENRDETIQFEFGIACDVGRKRRGKPNQDSADVILPYMAEPWHPPLLVVADGLGKYVGGSLASKIVVETFRQQFKQAAHPANYPELLLKCVYAAHYMIRAEGTKDPQLALMGSTVVAVALDGEKLFLLNIGDSRAYLLHGPKMMQISHDQSWVAAQVRAGILSEQEARTNPNRNRLMMAITAKRTEIEPFLMDMDLEPTDIVVMCSDGLWGVVPETLIWAAARELPPQEAADKLVTLANNSSGPDNISVIIARRADFHQEAGDASLEDTNP